MDIKALLDEKKSLVDAYLRKYIQMKKDVPLLIYQAMEYSLFAGGKRLRPILAMAGCEVCGGNWEDAMPFACALEMIHTYSLIHDDLPAMDNDDYRRGKLTNHKVFGEAVAILAGDGLLNLAYEIMLDFAGKSSNHLEAARLIARAAGVRGMIAGQVIDLQCENKEVDLDTLKQMHQKKTGALINASILSGALIAGCSKAEYQSLSQFGERLGLAFQIRDDILDIIGDEKLLGKKTGSDIANKKSTYATLLGIQRSKDLVEKLGEEAKKFLQPFAERGEFLLKFADYLVNREY